MMNELESLRNKDWLEERISDLEDKNLEMTHVEVKWIEFKKLQTL